MDPYKQTDPEKATGASGSHDGQTYDDTHAQRQVSTDGFLPADSSSGGHDAPVASSRTKRPFMPASFYAAPKLPKLPKIEETPPPKRAVPAEPGGQGLRDALSVIGVLASALILAFGLINFVFQSYQVEGPSMRTTLENHDHLIVWKVGRTLANIEHKPYIPDRGDIIIFNEPSGAESGAPPNKQLIKRVIGLPGDRVVYHGTTLTVYNAQHPDGFDPDKTMPYGKNIIFEKPSNVEYSVGPGQVFVSGDNRDNSLDSRIFGPIDAHLIVGKLAVRILPIDTFKVF